MSGREEVTGAAEGTEVDDVGSEAEAERGLTRAERQAPRAREKADRAAERAAAARVRLDRARERSTPEPGTPSAGRGRRRRPGLVLAAAGLACVLLVATGVLGLVRAHDLRSTPSASNRALVDTDATNQVEGEVGNALTRVLSYDYTKPDQTEASAKQYLTGKARQQYAVLFAALQKKAPGQKLTLTARISVIGVKQLEGDRASLLVFLDQTSSRASDRKSSLAAAQLRIGATRVDGQWRVSSIDTI